MKRLSILAVFVLFSHLSYSQWTKNWGDDKAFISNMGQYENLYNLPEKEPILYAYDGDKEDLFFTKNKLIYRFIEIEKKNEENEWEEKIKFLKKGLTAKDWHEYEMNELRGKVKKEFIFTEWLNTNPNAEIIGENKTSYYHNYSFKKNNKWESINYVPSFKKIIYKNLYPNIDLVYEFHPQGGLKYSLILHPGADISAIKLKYSNPIRLKNGNLYINGKMGKITEYAPVTFYADNGKAISSRFEIKNNIVSFKIDEPTMNNKTIIIDPWVVSETFNSSTAVWEVETDQSGNIYVIGGETPMQLKKYNSSGTLQWTYTTSWDTASVWLGTLATDNVGYSYITAGTAPEIAKISPSGTMVWINSGLNNTCEYWSITFNCDKTKLIVGGTYVPNPLSFEYSSSIYDIDINNGDVLSHVEFETTNIGGFQIPPITPIEIRSISASKNAKYIYLTHNSVGAINQNISLCPNDEPVFHVDNDHHLGYKCENYLPETQNGGGLKAIVANDNFIYTHAGDKIYKRSMFDGSLITQTNIPNGSATLSLGALVVENSGLAVDDCGNVYAGSQNKIIKFDPDLNILGQYDVNMVVYDVAVNNNGEVIAVGAQYNNQATNRNGKIQAVNASACAQYYPICCDANICPTGPFCSTDSPINLISSTPGGTWSGQGITNATSGTFDPSVAGVGSHTIYYTIDCGTDSIIIDVLDCAPITVCANDTNLQASGGSNTIQWQTQTQTTTTPANEEECIACGGTPQVIMGQYLGCTPPVCTITTWNTYATGYTASIPETWPLLVTDGTDSVIFNAFGEIPPCGNCTPPSLSDNITHETCSGLNNGAINLTVTGSSTYTYNWTGPNGFTSNAEDLNNLAPGTYNVTVTDAANSTCSTTATYTVNAGNPNPSPTISGSSTFCVGGSTTLDAGNYASYLWSNNATTQTITIDTPGLYSVTVTDNNGCTGTTSVNVTQSTNLSPTITGTLAICSGDSTILDAGPGYASYQWSTSETSQTITVTSAGSYSVTVSDANGCTGSDQVTVVESDNPNPTIIGDTIICAGSSTTLDAGSGFASYLWNNNAQTQTITVNTAGTYSVTVTNNEGCSGTTQVTVVVINNSNPNAGIDDTTCGLSYTLNAIPSSGSTGIWTYLGTGTAMFSSNTDPNASVTVSTSGDYQFIWTEDYQGCGGSDTVLIHFTAIPTSDFTADSIICSGDASLVTYNGNAEPNSVFTWSWDGGNAIPGTGPGPHTVSWTTSGVHTITLTVSTNGCNSNPTSVTVYNPMPLNLTFSKTDIICNGDLTGAIDLTVTGGHQPYSYQWNNGQTVEDLTNIPAGIYTVTVTDASGCTAISGIEVTEPPQLVATVTPDQYSCIGATTYLTITATGGAGGYQYYWNGQLSNPTITVSPETTTTYYAYVIDANGCSTPILSTTVNVAPPLHVNLIANTNYVCQGDAVILTPVIWGGVGAPYIIYNQNGDVVDPPIYIYPENSGYYTIRAEDLCGSWDTAGVYIHVWPLPSPNILADTLQGCMPLTVHFIETNPDSGQSYVWDFGDATNLSLSKNPVHTYTTSGTFDVSITVTSIHGCKNIVVYNNMITVWPTPNAAYIWEPEVVTEIKPVITFTNLSTGAEWYQWIFGDGDSSSVVNPEHRYPGKGEYETQLIAVSNKGCTDTANAVIKILEQYTFYAPTAFSPDGDNNNDFFYIMAHGIKEEGFKLEIYDRWGEIIWSTDKFIEIEERSEKWDGRTQDGNIVPIGTYTWRCIFKDNSNITHEEVGAINVIR